MIKNSNTVKFLEKWQKAEETKIKFTLLFE